LSDEPSAALRLSALPHTWLIDVDGTLVEHNGYKHGGDVLLPGVRDFWRGLPASDVIVLLSARAEAEKPATLAFLRAEGLRFDVAIFGLPVGERILINDAKPSGMTTAFALSVRRDEGLGGCAWRVDPGL
jgi:hypothetical protein